MSTFQLLMLVASGYFAFRIYQHVKMLQDKESFEVEQGVATVIEHFDNLIDRADEEFKSGNYKVALELLEDALSKDRYNSEILFKLGFVSQKLSRDDEALRYYRDSLEIDDRNEFAHNAIASLYRKMKEYKEAVVHLEKSIKLDDKNARTYYNFGNLLVDMQEIQKAKEMYEKALEIEPEFDEARYELERLSDNRADI